MLFVFLGIIRRNSLGGSSSGSQDKLGKGVTFATDISRMVRAAHCINRLYITIILLVKLDRNRLCSHFMYFFFLLFSFS